MSNKSRLQFLIPPSTRILRIERDYKQRKWIVWLATKDYKHGTYLLLEDECNTVTRITERDDESIDELEIGERL